MSAMGTGVPGIGISDLVQTATPRQEFLPYQFWQKITQPSISFQFEAVTEKLSS